LDRNKLIKEKLYAVLRQDLLAALVASDAGTARAGRLLQQLGYRMLVASVGLRGARAALGRHCSTRSWLRYKKGLKSIPGMSNGLQRVTKASA
jgi:hypothetical protein